MRKNIKAALIKVMTGFATIIIASLVIGCNNNKPAQPPPAPKVSAAVKAFQERMKHKVIDTTIPKAIILYKETIFDFGNLKSGDVVTHNFIFTNTSTNPLVVYNVEGTCGCTVPHWPSKPISPNDTGHITVQYNSNGESGLQNKRVRVFTNTKTMESDIFFKANVKK